MHWQTRAEAKAKAKWETIRMRKIETLTVCLLITVAGCNPTTFSKCDAVVTDARNANAAFRAKMPNAIR